MSTNGEKTVISYFEENGFISEKIRESDQKTPDFRVYKDEELVFYCEEKTIDYDDFIKVGKVIHVDDNTNSKLSTKIHTAIKQFESINKDHKYSNILAINNNDPLININDLFTAVTTFALVEDGGKIKMKSRLGRIGKKIDVIDLFLWFEKGKFINCICNCLLENESKHKCIKRYFTEDM